MILSTSLIVLLAGTLFVAPPAQPPPTAAPPPVQAPAVHPPPDAPAEPPSGTARTTVLDPSIDELLDALERAADDLRDFTADVSYEKLDALTEGVELQYGRLLFERKGDAALRTTRLGVVFEISVDSTGRQLPLRQHFVFAEGWLCETDVARKQFIKRQVVAAGETFDPLKLGEGPFPLPIGQKKSEVLARFVASAAPSPEHPQLTSLDPARIRPLRLVPHAGTQEAKEFSYVDLYYDESLLPVGVVAISPDGNRKVVRLRNVKRNAGLASEDAALLSIEAPEVEGWTVDVRPLKAEQGAS